MTMFLTAVWRNVAILNFEIDREVLAPLTPNGTELDTFDGRTLVSLVGFQFADTRVLGLRIPGYVTFEEVNLRFYVRRREGRGWKRGVVFVREIVPRRAVAWLARLRYQERYCALPMRHHVETSVIGLPSAVSFEWRRGGAWEGFGLRTVGEAVVPKSGSAAEFITEHYWGYTRLRNGSSSEYRVGHAQWRVWGAADPWLRCDAAGLYGPAFARALSAPPHSAFLAEGSRVGVFTPRRIG